MMPAEQPRSANRHHQLFSPLPITRHSQKSELSILAYRSYPLSTFVNASTLPLKRRSFCRPSLNPKPNTIQNSNHETNQRTSYNNSSRQLASKQDGENLPFQVVIHAVKSTSQNPSQTSHQTYHHIIIPRRVIKFNANDDFPVSQPGAGLTSPLVSLGGIQTSPEPGPSSASPPTDYPLTHEPPLPPSSVQTPERNDKVSLCASTLE